jgi:hypothetical protein
MLMFSGPGMLPIVGRVHSSVKAGSSIKFSGAPGESEIFIYYTDTYYIIML